MGNCSAVQQPTTNYIRVLEPPCEELCSRDSEAPLNGNLRLIDHKNTLLRSRVTHIQSITVFFREYITGIEIRYRLDAQSRVLKLFGTGNYEHEYTVTFDNDEHIDHITCYYDNTALTTLHFRTTKGNLVFVGNEDKGEFKKEINLKDEESGVIGFKALTGEYLSNLWVYHGKLLNGLNGGQSRKLSAQGIPTAWQ